MSRSWTVSAPRTLRRLLGHLAAERLDTSSSRSPALFAYLAALNILDAEVLFGDLRTKDLLDPSGAAPRSIERDRLFHRKHLDSLGISGTY